MREQWVVGILVLCVIVIGFFDPRYVWFLQSAFRGAEIPGGAHDSEVEGLRAQLAVLNELQESGYPISLPYTVAPVYSRYPFNFKHELLIAAGSRLGIKAGDPVVLAPRATGTAPVLIGSVKEVFEDAAVVRTVFDGGFELPVRVGTTRMNALLKGGNTPKITLIPRGRPVAGGDLVASAGPTAPYGLAVGEIGEVRPSRDALFYEASLEVPYDVNVLRAVTVLRGRPQFESR